MTVRFSNLTRYFKEVFSLWNKTYGILVGFFYIPATVLFFLRLIVEQKINKPWLDSLNDYLFVIALIATIFAYIIANYLLWLRSNTIDKVNIDIYGYKVVVGEDLSKHKHTSPSTEIIELNSALQQSAGLYFEYLHDKTYHDKIESIIKAMEMGLYVLRINLSNNTGKTIHEPIIEMFSENILFYNIPLKQDEFYNDVLDIKALDIEKLVDYSHKRIPIVNDLVPGDCYMLPNPVVCINASSEFPRIEFKILSSDLAKPLNETKIIEIKKLNSHEIKVSSIAQ